MKKVKSSTTSKKENTEQKNGSRSSYIKIYRNNTAELNAKRRKTLRHQEFNRFFMKCNFLYYTTKCKKSKRESTKERRWEKRKNREGGKWCREGRKRKNEGGQDRSRKENKWWKPTLFCFLQKINERKRRSTEFYKS